MRPISITSLCILLLAGFFSCLTPVLAQYDGGYDSGYNGGHGGGYSDGYTCWQCPVCGSVFQLTASEAASTSPYELCPVCGLAYAAYFIQVPCGSNTPQVPGYSNGTSTQTTSVPSANGEESSQPAQLSNAAQNKGKILMVVAPKDYQEMELNVPRDYFKSKGYAVVVASKGVETAKSTGGETTPVDIDIKSAKVSDYEAIVFVGGDGIYDQRLNEDRDFQQLAKSASSQRILTAAICLGPWILADAGLLAGKRATAAETDHIREKGAIVVEDSVVRDGYIITGNGPYASEDFAKAVVDALSGEGGVNSEEHLAKYECTVCHYVYDPAVGDPRIGIPAGTPFEKLPASWKCPCGAEKDKFVKI